MCCKRDMLSITSRQLEPARKGACLTQEGLGSRRNVPGTLKLQRQLHTLFYGADNREWLYQDFAITSPSEVLLHHIAVSGFRHMALLSHCHGHRVT